MTFKEIQELIKLISRSDLAEFKMKDGEFELAIRTKYYGKAQPVAPLMAAAPPPPLAAPAPVQPALAAPAPAPAPAPRAAAEPEAAPAKKDTGDDSSRYVSIKSPIVGTFYRSASPEKPAYAKVGDVVEVGTVVCIVEAMKLFNEIESDTAGKIVKVMVEDAQPVEYDQVLFLVDPKG